MNEDHYLRHQLSLIPEQSGILAMAINIVNKNYHQPSLSIITNCSTFVDNIWTTIVDKDENPAYKVEVTNDGLSYLIYMITGL